MAHDRCPAADAWTTRLYSFLHVAKPLLGFPSSVMPVEVYAQMAQLSVISRTGGCARVGG
eukprot:314876-Amphidinium_carterae.3